MIETLEKLNEEIKAKKLGDFKKEIVECGDTTAIAAFFRSKGIEISASCAEKVYEIINKAEELSDDELARTAGGKKVQVNDDICPSCGGKTNQNVTLKLDRVEGCYDCDEVFYWKYKCPLCHSSFRYYINDGYWTD